MKFSKSTFIFWLAVAALLGWLAFKLFWPQGPQPVWRIEGGNKRAELWIAQDGSIISGGSAAYSPEGDELWKFTERQDDVFISYSAAGNRLYIAQRDGTLRAMDPEGVEYWSIDVTGPADLTGGWLVGDRYFLNDSSQTLHVLDLDGTELWQAPSYNLMNEPPAICPVTGNVYMAGVDQQGAPRWMWALSPAGAELWKLDTVKGPGTDLLVTKAGTLLFPSNGSGLQAFDTEGNLLWTAIPGGTIWSAPVEGPDGTIYCGAAGGDYYAVNPDGSLRWSHDLRRPEDFETLIRGRAALAGDRLVVAAGTMPKHIPNSRMIIFRMNRNNIESMVVGPGRLYLLDARTGNCLWEVETKWGLECSPVIGADNLVFVCSWQPEMLAFRLPEID